MIHLDFKPPSFNSMEPMLPEPTLDTLRVQAIKLHRRKHIIIAMGCMLLVCIIGGMWWYYTTPSLETKILEQAGTHMGDGLEGMEPLLIPLKEEPPPFKVQVIDDEPLYRQAEDAFLQKNWPVAIQKYKALVALYPQNISLWFNLALSYHHNQDPTNARYWYEKILLHQANHKDAMRNLDILNRTMLQKNLTKELKDTEHTSRTDQS